MRKMWCVVVMWMVCGAAGGHALAPRGEKGPELTLAVEGAARYVILLPAEPDTRERKAAEDLKQWLDEITSAEFRIIREGEDGAGERLISIGRTKLAEASGPETDLGDDGIQIAVADEGKQLILQGGRGRGMVNAVYAFLEEDLGCRWYDGDAVLPSARTLEVSPVPRAYVPRLRLRDPFYKVSFDETWSLRNRTNAPDARVREEWGGRIDYGNMFVHTFHRLVPPGKYFAEHPEYFQMNPDGQRVAVQLCTTNPQLRQLVTQRVREILAEQPQIDIISISKEDTVQVCHCEPCKQLRDAEGSDMANQLLLVNEVAEAIEEDHRHVVIDTLAYLETIAVPKTMRPRKNVVIRLCNDSVGAWSKPFTAAEQLRIAELTRAWSAVHDRLYIWDYNVNFSHYLAPMPNMEVIAANIRFWVEHNAEGVMTQGGYQGMAERDRMRSWVIAKLMWDPELDQQALVDDFIHGYYGAAAPMVAEYDKLLREHAEKHRAQLDAPPGGIRYPMDLAFLSREFIDAATGMFERARRAAGEEQALLHKVERAELPILYVQLSRGPGFVGEGYRAVIDRFEAIARREGATHLAEGPANLDARLANWRAQVEQ
jgi:hypothetical protein